MKTTQTQSRPRLYLVEDSPIVLDRLIESIEERGAAKIIGHAETAAEAIADIASLHPDVITIDVLLKRGSGFDVLEAIAINHDDHPPVRIVLTNNATDAFRDAAQQLGAEYFFDKAREIREALDVLATLEVNDAHARAA